MNRTPRQILRASLATLAVAFAVLAASAASADAYIYWSNGGSGAGTTIGRANLDLVPADLAAGERGTAHGQHQRDDRNDHRR